MGEQVITILVVVLRGLTILPGMMLHFDIDRPKSVAVVRRAVVGDQKLFLVTQKYPEIVEPKQGDLLQVGIVAVVRQLVKLPDKVVRVLVGGLERTELLCLEAEEPAMMGEVATTGTEEDDLDSLTQEAVLRILKDELKEYRRANLKITREIPPNLTIITDSNEILDQIAIQLPWDYTIRQTMLESSSLPARYEVVMHTLLTEMEIYRIKKEFREKVKVDIDQNQKEYISREQVKVARQELEEDAVSGADEYQKELDTLKADKEVKGRLHKEVERFHNMPVRNQKASVLHTYVEALLDPPWKKTSKDNDDIKHARRILSEDHYGLEQVKERILERLVVRALTKKGIGPIICPMGPPGTGKASIARSAARTLNKKYMRISLGSVRGGVEIRDHKKTYVGTIPGCIVENVCRASANNPLMFSDEIDKVSSDCKGDTSPAFLEVLSGEQNVKFRDHYVGLPIDLSQVPFIVTASTTQIMPGPLLDHMKLIEADSYTENEKSHMARDYLVAKQTERNGFKEGQITFSDKSLERMTHNYTKEAGVRNLECHIGDVCRKAARQFLEDKKESIKITKSNLERYLGKEEVTFENVNEEDEIDVMRGLAWTSAGGNTLQIETSVMPGRGSLLMTGQLGDVMKKSAQIVLIYVRSVCPEYGIDDGYFEKHDLHIRIPEGAVPKDGPSVGIITATIILSTVISKSVQAEATMTGEITLYGRVLPIGGLKEEILTAKMAHVEKALIPDKNRPDITELFKEITRGLDIVYVEVMGDVVSKAFVQSADRNQEKQI